MIDFTSKIKNNHSVNKWEFAFSILLSILLFYLFITRLFYCAPPGDEINNIIMAWHVANGQKPWVEVWELFQAGNSFLSPFLWIFYKIQGSTDGIIVFSRMIYLCCTVIVALLTLKIVSNFLDIIGKIWTFNAIVTYSPFCLYYIWYDTVGIILMLLGLLFIYYGIERQNNSALSNMLFFIAGITHALMSYAYQSYIVVVIICFFILFLLYKKTKEVKLLNINMYVFGGGLILIIFLAYLSYVNFSNTIFFDKFIMNSIIAGHSSTSDTSFIIKFARTIYLPLKLYWPVILPSFVSIYFFLFLKRKITLFFLSLFITIIFSSIYFYKLGPTATYYFSFICGCCSMLLFLALKKSNFYLNVLFSLLFISSIFGYFLTGLTSNDSYKSVFGFFTSYVLVFVLLGYYRKISINHKQKLFFHFVMIFIVFTECIYFLSNTFMADRVRDNSHYIDYGVRKGIYVRNVDKRYAEIEIWVKSNLIKTDQSILVTSCELNSIYLTKDINAASYLFGWVPYQRVNTNQISWDATKYYWKKISGKPSVIIDEDMYRESSIFKEIIDTYYKKIDEFDNVSFYRLVN